MRRYETFVIIDPDLSQDQREPLIARVEELITQMDGFLVFTDDWGERKLAYDIKKKGRGYYVRFDFCGLAPLVNEIERFCRIDDRALKFMTILLNEDADLEKIKAEKAAREAAAKESADRESAAAEAAAKEAAAKESADRESAAAEAAAKEAVAKESADRESAAAEAAAAENLSNFDSAPEEDQGKESTPAEEKAKSDEDVPSSNTKDAAAAKTPPSTIEEA